MHQSQKTISEIKNKKLSYRRETVLQGAYVVHECDGQTGRQTEPLLAIEQ